MEDVKPQPKSDEFTILIDKTETLPATVTIKTEQGSPGPPSPAVEEVHEKCIIQNEFEVCEDHIITFPNDSNKNTVFVPRPASEDDSNPIGDSGSDLSDTEISYRPVRPVERQKMRPWLFDLLDKANVPGLSWQNRSERIFRISWKHAAHNCFDRNTDSDLFERWAHHTGRRHEGNHKRWKANFRCALNSLPDVIELRDLGVRKGNNAFKVYKFIDLNDKKAKDKTKVYSISDGEFKVKDKSKQQQAQNIPGLRSRTAAARQATTQPNSPSGQNLLTADSGMLQTLLHAIELKNMEAAQKHMEDDDSKSSVKRAASAEKATLRIKRRKKDTSKKKSQDDSPDISDTENSSRSQDSNQSGVSDKPLTGTEDTPISSPTPGQNQQYISVLPMKIPHLGVSQVLVPCHVTTSKTKTELTTAESKAIGNSPTSFSIPANLFAASQVSKTQQSSTPVSSMTSTSTNAATYMKNISSYLTAQIVGVGKIEGQQIVQGQPLAPKVSATATSATGEKQKFEVTIPYTVLEALKSKQLAVQEANKTVSKQEDSQPKKEVSTGVAVTQSTNPVNSIPKLEVNKDVTSIAAALRMPLSQSVAQGLPVLSTAYSLTGSDIRSKLVSRINTNAIARPILVSVPSTQTIRPKLDKVTIQDVSHLLGTNAGQVKIADASKLTKEPSSRSSSNASTPVAFLDQTNLGNTPSAVVQPVEQLSDINVNINNVDDITYVGSGRSTPSQTPADMIETTDISHPSSSCTPDTRPEYLTEQVTINLEKISDDHMSAEVVEEGIHITTQQYMCLWCQLKFESKMDLLQHFVSLHQDMLVSDEGNSELVVEATSLLSQAGADSASLDSDRGSCVLDLSSKAKCKLEKNKDGRYTQVVDLTNQEIPESIDEALDLTKSKVNDEPKDGNSNIVVKAINIPPQDNRPKYSLNSLIEALRNTIEQDRRDGKIEHTTLEEDCAPQSDVEGSSDEENELAQSSDLKYPEPSSDSESSRDAQNQANNDTEVQVSVKTFQVDGKTMYRCSKCNKVFSKTCTFARHAMVHAKLYPYQCGVCDAKFRDMRIMLRHLDWHGENVDCPCKKCEKINDEERKKSEDKGTKFRFQCDICLKKFISDEVCIAHINMHKKKSKLQCDICKMEFYCNKKLSRHRKISHSIQYCPVCLEACSDLSIHIQKHQGSVLFRCGLCADGFNSRPQLHEHLKVHTFLGKGSERSEGDSKQGQKKQKAASLDNSKSSAYTRTVTISSNKIRKGKRKSGSVSASPNKKVNVIAKDNIKIETFDKNYPGKIVTKAVILEKDIEVEVKEHDNEDKQETPEETGFGDKEESTELCTSNVIISDQVHQDVSQNVNENITTVSIEFETSSVESESPKKIPDNALPIQDSGINLRRRSSRRCRWHDNDSICERCDVTFIRKIAFERKPKKGRDSPRSLEDGSTIPVLTRDEGIPILYDDMYAQHIDDDDDGNMPQLLNMDGEEEVITETVHETVLGNIPTFVQDAFNTEDREVKSQDNSKVSVESS